MLHLFSFVKLCLKAAPITGKGDHDLRAIQNTRVLQGLERVDDDDITGLHVFNSRAGRP